MTAPDGSLLYQNFVYNDPADLIFNPPLAFDSPDPSQRVLHYCSLYNNGVAADGTPDPTTVTRASHVPPQGFRCQPVACTAGRIGASCATDATCDSSPGARDGVCDACRITGGESTENEMFILIGSYYVNSGGEVTSGVTQGLNASRRDPRRRGTLDRDRRRAAAGGGVQFLARRARWDGRQPVGRGPR